MTTNQVTVYGQVKPDGTLEVTERLAFAAWACAGNRGPAQPCSREKIRDRSSAGSGRGGRPGGP